jgi:hypothetical protein
MNEWALLHRGKIVNVVTTELTKEQVQEQHPTYHVVDLHSLPPEAKEAYWSKRT